jgi:NAD(P)-dependent dehydrogenase (short-subunit alcohol dehydrogenase family)
MMAEGDTRSVLDFFKLEGRVALVTGGSKGLGKSMAIGLAEAGATTVLCSRDLEACRAAAAEITERTGRESLGLQADVTEEGQVAALFAQIVDRFGHLDVLINNAGVNFRRRIEDYTLEEWKRIIDVNLTGVWLCCREAARVMLPRRCGTVVNIASVMGQIALPERTPYAASKAGVVGLTRVLALEWATVGLRCNALCPGPFLTEMNLPLLDDPEKANSLVAQTAMKRWASLEEIRGAALFLASEASSYVTGATLFIDGGWTVQ